MLTARGEGWVEPAAREVAAPGPEVRLELRAGVTLEVHATQAGRPLAQVSVEGLPRDPEVVYDSEPVAAGLSPERWTDEAGVARFPGLRPGRYRLRASASRGGARTLTVEARGALVRVEVDFGGAAGVRGRLLRARRDAPQVEALLALPDDEAGRLAELGFDAGEPGLVHDGAFALAGLRPGRLHVYALGRAPGGGMWLLRVASLELRPGETLERDLQVPRPTGALHVSAPQGAPPLQGLVACELGSPSAGVFKARGSTRAGSALELGGLPAGRYRVEAAGFVAREVELVDAGRLDLELAPER
ncbi:MAG: hypothetical protein AB7N76_09980 [Planctomycetota bacterium]